MHWSLPAAPALGLLAIVARETEVTGVAVLPAAVAVVGAAPGLRVTRARTA